MSLQTQVAASLHDHAVQLVSQTQLTGEPSSNALRGLIRRAGHRLTAAIRGVGGHRSRTHHGEDSPRQQPSVSRRSDPPAPPESGAPTRTQSMDRRTPPIAAPRRHSQPPRASTSTHEHMGLDMNEVPVPSPHDYDDYLGTQNSQFDTAWEGLGGGIFDGTFTSNVTFQDLLDQATNPIPHPDQPGQSNWCEQTLYQQPMYGEQTPYSVQPQVVQGQHTPYEQNMMAGFPYYGGSAYAISSHPGYIPTQEQPPQQTRFGPAQAAGQRTIHPPDHYTPSTYATRGRRG